jgi:DNA replication protein DnaC
MLPRPTVPLRSAASGRPFRFGRLANVAKTHRAVAIGREVIVAGHSALSVAATALVAALAKAHAEGRLEENLADFGKPKLLIVDELGHLPMEPDAADLFFQLVGRRQERGAMLITSNRAVGE